MDYYLYSHSNADGIFYIGKGKYGRADLWGRTKEWNEIAAKGYTTKIEANGSEKDILSLERIIIKSLVEQGVKLVNMQHNKYWDGYYQTFDYSGKTLADKLNKNGKYNSGENNGCFGRTGEKHPMFGKVHVMRGKKNPGATLGNNKRWQKVKLAKANNYRRNGE